MESLASGSLRLGSGGRAHERPQTPSARAGRVARNRVVDDAGSMHFRMALACAVQQEVIPRLVLAHKPRESPSSHSGAASVPQAPAASQVRTCDIDAIANLLLAPDAEPGKACMSLSRGLGLPVETVYLSLLAPVSRHLRALWEQDCCTFVEMSAALGRLQQFLHELSPAFDRASDSRTRGR